MARSRNKRLFIGLSDGLPLVSVALGKPIRGLPFARRRRVSGPKERASRYMRKALDVEGSLNYLRASLASSFTRSLALSQSALASDRIFSHLDRVCLSSSEL